MTEFPIPESPHALDLRTPTSKTKPKASQVPEGLEKGFRSLLILGPSGCVLNCCLKGL